MKNIFGIDITENKRNRDIDGAGFITKRLSPELQKDFDKCFPTFDSAEGKIVWFMILVVVVKCISAIFSCIFLLSIFRIFFDYIFDNGISLVKAYHNAPFIFHIGTASVMVYIFCIFAERYADKKSDQSTDYDESDDDEDFYLETMSKADEELQVPDNAVYMDFFGFKYKIKKGRLRLVMNKYYNLEYSVFVQNGDLCIADLDWVMTIPLNSICGIEKAENKATINVWNKEHDFYSKYHEKYEVDKKIGKNDIFAYSAYFYKVHINHINGEFELFVPNYEIEAFTDLIKIRLEE